MYPAVPTHAGGRVEGMVMKVIEEDPMATRRLGQVRRVYWVVLAGALLVALAVPGARLWRAASSALTAQACVWPSSPHAGGTAQLIVSVPEPTDRAAVQGPWAHVVAEWDMVTMTMGTQVLTVPGSSHSAGTFAVPLHLTMAGPWWARITLQTPGRPVWHAQVRFTVLPAAGSSPASIGLAAMTAGDPCVSSGKSGTS
jgi:hypothetical protein